MGGPLSPLAIFATNIMALGLLPTTFGMRASHQPCAYIIR